MKPKHLTMVSLYFRKAFDEIKNNGKPQGQTLIKWKKMLKERLGDTWDKTDEWYWDLLFDVNFRGVREEELVEKAAEKKDPEYEQFVWDVVNKKYEKKPSIIILGNVPGGRIIKSGGN